MDRPLTSLESITCSRLNGAFNDLWHRYEMVVKGFKGSAKFINSRNPNFTDHGECHILDVQKTIYSMIETCIDKLTALELYILCFASYFHDWGNIISRQEHRDYAYHFYNGIFSNPQRDKQESSIINKLVWSHTGTSSSGNKDTLKDVSEKMSLYGNYVNARRLAAILRFADELAESPKRTDSFYVSNTRLNKDSLCHHLYSNCVDISCKTMEGRILIDLHVGFSIQHKEYYAVFVGTGKKVNLSRFIDCLEKKLRKADEERKYTNYYLKDFLHFSEISANIKFLKVKKSALSGEGFERESFSRTITLDDKEIPGEKDYQSRLLNIDEIISSLQ
ncbi:MAG: hypothetical protein LBU06_09795 [Desulfovibrio sp.]|jgi:hypothetical protein|nr:hypothetical protein [Desulfovibrio sp.]